MINRQNVKQILLNAYHDLRLRAAATGVFALAWWGLLYPELCFTENTYEQVIVTEGQEIETEQSDYRDVLSATGDEIVVRSRLLEWLEQKTVGKK